MYPYYRVVASYQACCFCERPTFPLGERVPNEGRIQRKKLLEEYAIANALQSVHYTPLAYGNGASMLAEAAIACAHREKQFVRLEVVPVRQ